MEENIYCPEVYGDPALLLPRYLSVAGRVRDQVGFAPHFRDASLELVDQARRSKEVKFLNVTADIDAFVQELVSCECVIASSLHALIVADAYGIPSLWVRLSDNPRGDLFKYQDYYQSIGLKSMKPHEAGSMVELVRLAERCEMHELKIDMEALYQSCPFRANPKDGGS